MSPWTSLMLLPLEVSFCAEAPEVLRVTASRVKSGLLARLSITLPPCLPVAPVTRMALDMIVVDSEVVLSCVDLNQWIELM